MVRTIDTIVLKKNGQITKSDIFFYNYFTSLLHIDFFVFGSGDADPVPYAM